MTDDNAAVPLRHLNLSTRAYRCLVSAGFETIADVEPRTDKELRSIKGLGRHTIPEIRSIIASIRGGRADNSRNGVDLEKKVAALQAENKWLRTLLYAVGLHNLHGIDPLLAREAEIVGERLAGAKLRDVAKEQGVSHQRIQQICCRFAERLQAAVQVLSESAPGYAAAIAEAETEADRERNERQARERVAANEAKMAYAKAEEEEKRKQEEVRAMRVYVYDPSVRASRGERIPPRCMDCKSSLPEGAPVWTKRCKFCRSRNKTVRRRNEKARQKFTERAPTSCGLSPEK